MGLDAVVRSARTIAKRVTRDLQVEVTHASWASQSVTGQPTYASGVTRRAILESQPKTIRQVNGQEVVSVATLTFLDDVELDLRDQITLPDGATAPILGFAGVVDPETGRPYVPAVYLGAA